MCHFWSVFVVSATKIPSPSSVSSFLLPLKATQPLPSCAAPCFSLVDTDAVDMDMVDMDITHNIYMSPILISHIQFADPVVQFGPVSGQSFYWGTRQSIGGLVSTFLAP